MKNLCLLLICMVFAFSACNDSSPLSLAQQTTEPPAELESAPEVHIELPDDAMVDSESEAQIATKATEASTEFQTVPEVHDELSTDSIIESVPETQPTLDSETMTANESDKVKRIDIQHLLGEGESTVLFNDVKHEFGVFLECRDDKTTLPHYYEGGLIAHALNVENKDEAPLIAIIIDYRQSNGTTVFHFDGIDGTFTANDVLEHYDNQEPFTTESDFYEERLGAIESYGYYASEKRFVRYFFDEEWNVVAISFWVL